MSTHTYTADLHVPLSSKGQRLDRVLADLLGDASRSEIKNWILTGSVTVDQSVQRPSYRVRGNESIAVRAHRSNVMNWDSQQDVEFQIVFEDEHVLVINKPPGVVVHPGAGNPDHTLVNGLIAHRPILAELPRAGIVHRLDKNTSGLLVVAANRRSLEILVDAMSKRTVNRTYLCVVEGVMDSVQQADLRIGRHSIHRTRQQVREDGREALTTFVPLEPYRAHTAVHARLGTGRTHQIRVHAEAIRYPIVGDRTYGARGILPKTPSDQLVDVVRAFPRQALHAEVIGFDHPAAGKPFKFRCDPPRDMQLLLNVLEVDRENFLDS
ncbi:MAG: RluA family pseudouridine synthase [Gammaproteobacteria bacterium]|nr:RluA family pseudouridine synthase [Gammaproteobacteria bacterium]